MELGEKRRNGGKWEEIYTWETILNGIIVRLRIFDILTNNRFSSQLLELTMLPM